VGQQASGDGSTGWLIRPQGLWSGRLGWGVIHYGLLFERAPAAYIVRSSLPDRRRGLPAHRAEMQGWRLADLDGAVVLLLPRRWLIASGRLSPLAAFVPWLRFPLDPHVLEAFWLEPEETP